MFAHREPLICRIDHQGVFPLPALFQGRNNRTYSLIDRRHTFVDLLYPILKRRPFAACLVTHFLAILAGQQFQLPAETGDKATLERPDGTKMEIDPLQGRYIVRGVDRVGEYKLTVVEREVTVRANMRDDRESSVNAQDFVSIKKQQVKSVQDLRRYADFWKPLALLALCVLAVEWWMYSRRS